LSVKRLETTLPGVILIEPRVFRDDRGFFLETYHREKFQELGIEDEFVQDNHSLSSKNILRGLHAQIAKPQGKLVRATEGEIFDVAVDLRRGSPTYLDWFGACLSSDNFHMLWIPPGFAHGFCVISERAQVQYKCTDLYDPTDELTVRWDDPRIGVDWPIAEPQLSDRDRKAPRIDEVEQQLPSYPATPD
jgi:dTDP-4-dehydrorhamnose 3,5-epimerase